MANGLLADMSECTGVGGWVDFDSCVDFPYSLVFREYLTLSADRCRGLMFILNAIDNGVSFLHFHYL